jgi:hypothetical protein
LAATAVARESSAAVMLHGVFETPEHIIIDNVSGDANNEQIASTEVEHILRINTGI